MLTRIVTGIEKDKNQNPIDPAVVASTRSAALTKLARLFGGGSSYKGFGSYTHNLGDVVVEETLTFEIVHADDNLGNKAVRVFAEWLRDRLQQESVLVLTIHASSKLV